MKNEGKNNKIALRFDLEKQVEALHRSTQTKGSVLLRFAQALGRKARPPKKDGKKQEETNITPEQLQQQVEALHRSTRTSFGVTAPIHDKLRAKSTLYKRWHDPRTKLAFCRKILFLIKYGYVLCIYFTEPKRQFNIYRIYGKP